MPEYNDWDVIYTTIQFVENVIKSHKNVLNYERKNDINFIITRTQGDTIDMVLVNRYVLGIADIHGVLEEFPETNCIVTSANWNHYTWEAKEYGLNSKIGIFNTSEFFGALWWTEFIEYHKKDKDGKPIYATR